MYDVIVIGGGPSGMIAAIMSAKNNKVLLIEKNDTLGKKLKLTGGGRCNLTNLKNVEDFLKEVPTNNKFLYSALNQFGPKDIFDYFTNLGVPLKVEENNKVFPTDDKSSSIIEALKHELIRNNVEINFNEEVISIKEGEVITNKNNYKTNKIIISTGGYSYQNTGSTGDGYRFANELNQEVIPIYPSQTFLLTEDILPLAGITLDKVRINKKIEGSMLFTHSGLSGPSIFKVSEFVYKDLIEKKHVVLLIDLIPDYEVNELLDKLNNCDSKLDMFTFLKDYLPKRLIEYIFKDIDLFRKIVTISKIERNSIIVKLKEYAINIKATGAVEQAIVTGGGVSVKYINPKTMESTINKNIYFCGEVLDVHGSTGGYNLTIAFSTGYVAGINCRGS